MVCGVRDEVKNESGMASLVTLQVAALKSHPFDLQYAGVHARCVQTFMATLAGIGVQAVAVCLAPGSCTRGILAFGLVFGMCVSIPFVRCPGMDVLGRCCVYPGIAVYIAATQVFVQLENGSIHEQLEEVDTFYASRLVFSVIASSCLLVVALLVIWLKATHGHEQQVRICSIVALVACSFVLCVHPPATTVDGVPEPLQMLRITAIGKQKNSLSLYINNIYKCYM